MGLLLRNVVELFALIISLLVLARVLVSWIDDRGRSRLSLFLFRATEPILAPVRSMLPRTGMLDLSPMIVMIVLSVMLQALR